VGFKDAGALQRMVEERTVQPIRAEDMFGIRDKVTG
jgi:hypothetical protein